MRPTKILERVLQEANNKNIRYKFQLLFIKTCLISSGFDSNESFEMLRFQDNVDVKIHVKRIRYLSLHVLPATSSKKLIEDGISKPISDRAGQQYIHQLQLQKLNLQVFERKYCQVISNCQMVSAINMVYFRTKFSHKSGDEICFFDTFSSGNLSCDISFIVLFKL